MSTEKAQVSVSLQKLRLRRVEFDSIIRRREEFIFNGVCTEAMLHAC